jgi:hypothetical protein
MKLEVISEPLSTKSRHVSLKKMNWSSENVVTPGMAKLTPSVK